MIHVDVVRAATLVYDRVGLTEAPKVRETTTLQLSIDEHARSSGIHHSCRPTVHRATGSSCSSSTVVVVVVVVGSSGAADGSAVVGGTASRIATVVVIIIIVVIIIVVIIIVVVVGNHSGSGRILHDREGCQRTIDRQFELLQISASPTGLEDIALSREGLCLWVHK